MIKYSQKGIKSSILQCIIVEELAVNDKITIAASDMSSFAGRRIYCSVVKL